MSPVHIRPFRRSEREQLTALVNAHARRRARLLWLVVLNVPFVVAIFLVTVVLTRPASGAELAAGFEPCASSRSRTPAAERGIHRMLRRVPG